MRTTEDPLGLIEQIYPSYWPESKKQEVRGWSRMRQIVEVQKYAKYGDVYKALTMEQVQEVLDSTEKFGVEQVGDHWFRVGTQKHGFYTDRKGVEEFDRLLKERMSRVD